jgi:hypothetical protein
MDNKINLIDFGTCETNLRFYGGEGGAKLGIIYEGENWLLKYPRNTKALNNPKITYTTSPLSEYIGSQVYKALDIPVHDTLLGYRDDKVVAACKDFLLAGEILTDFRSIKNTYSDFTFDNGTTGSGTMLSEIITVFDTSDVLKEMPEAKERFWDMFVVDSLIGNYDRNNTNWGVVINVISEQITRLAPVYDNGAAFFDKRDEATFAKRLGDDKAIHADAIANATSAYLYDDGKKINPFEYISGHTNRDCDKALVRVTAKLDGVDLMNIINAIPLSDHGYDIISGAQADFYKEILRVRNVILHSEAAIAIKADNDQNEPIPYTPAPDEKDADTSLNPAETGEDYER